MDSASGDATDANCNGSKPYCVEKLEKEDDGETRTLLHEPKAANGGIAKKRQKSSRRRRVQWKDRNGNKLVEVLEFQPSDQSDSEDESSYGVWNLKYVIASCIHICCSRGDQRSSS